GLDPARDLISVEAGELNVHEDQIGTARRRQAQALLTRGGLDQLVTGAGQQIAKDPPVLLVILDRQDPLAHTASIGCSTRTGRLNENFDPTPMVDSTQMRPP